MDPPPFQTPPPPQAQAVAVAAAAEALQAPAPPANGSPPPPSAQAVAVAAEALQAPAPPANGSPPPPSAQAVAVAAEALQAPAPPAHGPPPPPQAQAVATEALQAPAPPAHGPPPPPQAPAVAGPPPPPSAQAVAVATEALQAPAPPAHGPPPPPQAPAVAGPPPPPQAPADGPPPPHGPPINPQVWRILGRSAAWIPVIGSRVYYFPQGHAENSIPAPDFGGLYPLPAILCDVTAVDFCATHDLMNHPFVRISLVPIGPDAPPIPLQLPVEDVAEYSFYAKKLVYSDVKGSLGLPKRLVEAMFPEGFAKGGTTINCFDVHGKVFSLKFNGPPFMVTTGWSKFREVKSLIVDDTIVFIKDPAGIMFVGFWRAESIHRRTPDLVHERMGPQKVLDAAHSAMENTNFVVEYYPHFKSQVFVVAAEIVEAAAAASAENAWYPEKPIQMPEDVISAGGSAQIAWHNGKLKGVVPEDPNWPDSPWRDIEVSWNDKKDATRTVYNVNGWQVSDTTFTRCNISQSLQSFSVSKLLDATTMGLTTPSMFKHSIFPAGRQEARQERTSSSLPPQSPSNEKSIKEDSEKADSFKLFGTVIDPHDYSKKQRKI